MDDKLKDLLQEMKDVQREKDSKQGTRQKLKDSVLKNRKQQTWHYRIVLPLMSVFLLVFSFLTWENDVVSFQETGTDEPVPIIQSVFL